MAQAARDQNRIPTLLGVSNADGITPVAVYADPTTHRLLVSNSGGSGTVTSVSVVTANGVSGSVATATTTPAITLTLGAITPTSVNGNTITSGTGTLTLSTFTLTVAANASVSGTNTGDQTSVSGNAGTVTVGDAGADTTTWPLVGTSQTGNLSPATSAALTYNASTGALSATSFVGAVTVTTNANLTGPITSVGNATSIASQTGTGTTFVVQNTPTLTTPVLGVATATSINGLTITSSTGTITITNGKTLAVTNSLTFSGTDSTVMTFPGASDTVVTLAATQELDNKTLDSSVGKGTWTASGTWTLPAWTMGGDVQMAENVSIVLDAALSADGKYCGITEAGVAGATLAFGDLVYLSVTDSRWELTDADADSTSGAVRLGICVLAAAADGNATTILTYGKIRADAAFPALTVGAPVYVSTTAGDVQTAQPSGTDDVIRIVGYGNTADELFFCPSNDYMTHT